MTRAKSCQGQTWKDDTFKLTHYGLGAMSLCLVLASPAAAIAREELVENGLQGLVHPGWGAVVQLVATSWAAEHLGPEGPVQTVLRETEAE